MNDKLVRNLGIALVVLLALFSFLRWQQNRSYEPAKPKGFDFASITAKNTSGIKVKGAGEDYTLTKSGDKWQLEGLEIDKSAIDALFANLKDAEIQQVAATKTDKIAALDVNDEKGKNVIFETKKGSFNFIIGKSSPDGSGFYIRMPKAKEAYLASGMLGGTFTKKAADWYSKQILSLTQDEIEKIDFSFSDASYTLTKDKKQWFVTEDGSKEKADTNKTSGLVSSLSMLNATSVETGKKVNFSDADTITIKGKKDKVLATLKLKAKNKKEFYLKSDKKEDFTFILDEFSAKNIRKKPKDLK